MARMLDDASRAKMLSALLDQSAPDDEGNTPDGPQVARMPEGAPNQENIINKMGASTQGGGDPTVPQQPMQQDAPMPGGMQPIPGTDMVAVPKQLAMSAMAMLMKQGSSRAVGQSAGANGAGGQEQEPDEDE